MAEGFNQMDRMYLWEELVRKCGVAFNPVDLVDEELEEAQDRFVGGIDYFIKEARTQMAKSMMDFGVLEDRLVYSNLSVGVLDLLFQIVGAEDLQFKVESIMDAKTFYRLFKYPSTFSDDRGILERMNKEERELSSFEHKLYSERVSFFKVLKEREIRHRVICEEDLGPLVDVRPCRTTLGIWNDVARNNTSVFISSKDVSASGEKLSDIGCRIGQAFGEIYNELMLLVVKMQWSIEEWQKAYPSSNLVHGVLEFVLNQGCQGFAQFGVRYKSEVNGLVLTTKYETRNKAITAKHVVMH